MGTNEAVMEPCMEQPPSVVQHNEKTTKAAAVKHTLNDHVDARGALPSRYTPAGANVQTWLKEKSIHDSREAFGTTSDTNHTKYWIVHGKMYDLTSFVDSHPGGSSWLSRTQGQDVTEAFEVHHLNMPKVEAVLKKYYVQDAVTSYVGRYVWNPNGFYRTVKSRVVKHFKKSPSSGLPSTGPTTEFLILSSAAVALHLSTFAAAVMYPSAITAIIAGLTLQMMHGIGHNALHRADNLWMYCYDLCGWKHHAHRISHALSHHLFPNTELDLEHPEPGSYVFTSNAHLNSRLVVITGPLQMWFGPLKTILVLWKDLVTLQEQWRMEYIFNILQLTLFIIGTNNSVWQGALYFGLMHFVSGFVIESAGFGLHRSAFCWSHGDPNAKFDFGEHCLAATADHDTEVSLPESLALYQILNNHGIHHLFPTIDKSRIAEIMPIFKETCEEFNIRWVDHVWADTFGSLWKVWLKGLYNDTPSISDAPSGHLPASKLVITTVNNDFGAIITGVDSVAALSDQDFKVLYRACIKYKVVVIRGTKCSISPDESLAFALKFPHNKTCDLMKFCGPMAAEGFDADEWRRFKLKSRPEIQLRGYKDLKDHYGVSGKLDSRKGAREFHSDSCHEYETPPVFTTLHCIETPGKDETLFLNAVAAYEDLSDDMKEVVEGLFVQYTQEPSMLHPSGLCAEFNNSESTTDESVRSSLGKLYGDAVLKKKQVEKDSGVTSSIANISQVHPLVWTHPNTGQKAIIVAGMWMHCLVHRDGTTWDVNDSHQFIYNLLHPASVKHLHSHQWQANDIVVFDNRSVLHSASAALTNVGDRLLHQIILCGDRVPVGPAGTGVNNPIVNPNCTLNPLHASLPAC